MHPYGFSGMGFDPMMMMNYGYGMLGMPYNGMMNPFGITGFTSNGNTYGGIGGPRTLYSKNLNQMNKRYSSGMFNNFYYSKVTYNANALRETVGPDFFCI